MADNKFTPFANGFGANVLSWGAWTAETSLIENGFQSGIAISEQFNRVFAQGSAAGYAVGQFVVDQLGVDADPLDAATLAANFKAALKFLPLAGGTMTGSIQFSTVSGSTGRTLIQGGMADNDLFRIHVGGTLTDSGWLEIATADNGNEPIYIRQYNGSFTSIKRTLTLLDGSGKSAFPGQVTASGGFVGNLTGRATSAGTADTAIKAQQDRNGKVIDETYSTILVGEVKMYAGSTAPAGYLWCNGQAVSRTTYAKLFAAIGTRWGSGNGSTTFNVPDFRKRFPEGANSGSEVGQTVQAGLPNITGSFGNCEEQSSVISGAFTRTQTQGGADADEPENHGYNIYMDASRSSAVYGRSSTVQPASAKCLYIIKY